jgi:carboxyl-terminal processing protease
VSRRILGAVRLILFGFLLAPHPASAQPGISRCSTTGQSLLVQDVLEAHYLWYQFLPRVDAASYDSPDAYLDAVRYRLDRGFSYITSRAANDAFYDASQFVGVGFTLRTDATELRIQQIFEGSPAQEAGLARGNRIVEINGTSVAALVAANAVDAALGPASVGVEVEIVLDTGNGGRRRVRMVKRVVTIPTVSSTQVFDIAGRRIGYLHFRNFVQPSYAALEAAFGSFRTAGVNDVVLDLRYNGGGLVDVAVHLGSLVGGALTNGNVFAELRHNPRDAARNETFRFRSALPALGLPRLVVITTRASASASEMLINALRPFIPVVVVGDATYGKPVGQNAVPFCDQILAPVTFASVNARGEGDFFDGIAADCPAPDDVDHELGNPAEGSLSVALNYIRTGSCSRSATAAVASTAAASSTEQSGSTMTAVLRPVGWRALINAY